VADPTPAARDLATRLTRLKASHPHIVAVFAFDNHVEVAWWSKRAGKPPPPPVVRDGVHVHYVHTPGPIMELGEMGVLGQVGDEARRAMQETPGYFAWWYVVKSLALVGVSVLLAYVLGKNAGRKVRTFGAVLHAVKDVRDGLA